MKKMFTITLLTFLVLHSQAQLIPPKRDSSNRDTLSFYNWKIVDKKGFYTVQNIEKAPSIHKKTLLTGRYMYQDSNSRTVDLELKNGVAVGNWQYYSHTFQGPIISSVVSFVDGYKNGVENVYSNEWNKETDCFESYLSRVVRYDIGKEQHDISYWRNGQVSMEYQFDKKGKRHGLFVAFNFDGLTSIKGEYMHGESVGTWEYFTSRGDMSKRILYKDGFVHTTTYYSNGKPHISKTTRNRILEDHFLNLSEKGDTLAYHFYKDGIEQGYQVSYVWLGYWQPGATAHYYTDDKGAIEGSYIQYFCDTGRLRIKGQYTSGSMRDGVWEYYQEDGRLYRSETFEKGLQKASSTRWLQDLKSGQYINAQYHQEIFPSQAAPQQVEEVPFFLFSE